MEVPVARSRKDDSRGELYCSFTVNIYENATECSFKNIGKLTLARLQRGINKLYKVRHHELVALRTRQDEERKEAA